MIESPQDELAAFIDEVEPDSIAKPLATDADLIDQIKRLAVLREQEKSLKEARKALEAQLDECQNLILLTYDARGVTKMGVEGVGLVYTQVDSYPNVKDMPGLVGWLKDKGEGAIVKEVVHPQTLRAWYRSLVTNGASQEGGTLPPPNLCEAYDKRSLRVRRA